MATDTLFQRYSIKIDSIAYRSNDPREATV